MRKLGYFVNIRSDFMDYILQARFYLIGGFLANLVNHTYKIVYDRVFG